MYIKRLKVIGYKKAAGKCATADVRFHSSLVELPEFSKCADFDRTFEYELTSDVFRYFFLPRFVDPKIEIFDTRLNSKSLL